MDEGNSNDPCDVLSMAVLGTPSSDAGEARDAVRSGTRERGERSCHLTETKI